MTFEQILQLIQEGTKLVQAIQGLGINLSGVQIHTSSPIDLLSFIRK